MSLFIASLNSGSNGNCYYIGNGDEAVFVDAGLSCRETEARMKRLGLNMNRVKAIFISHEHSDHILGANQLVTKYQIPVYVSQSTLKEAGFWKIRKFTFHFTDQQSVQIGGLRITAFQKKHDAYDPHSFVVSAEKTNIGVFTDIGTPCERLIHYFKQCHAAFLESNYDEDMLEKGRYPAYLKNRIICCYPIFPKKITHLNSLSHYFHQFFLIRRWSLPAGTANLPSMKLLSGNIHCACFFRKSFIVKSNN
jgi:phosphoribosyl 1,2-cyclic phosphodiesterase